MILFCHDATEWRFANW